MIYEDLADPDPAKPEPIEEEALMPYVEDFESMDTYDKYILALVMLQKYYDFPRALVTSRKRDSGRNTTGSHNYNPLLDTCIKKFQFHDRSISKYAANLISENIYS